MRTIDEVMAEEGLGFVAAVELLAKEADFQLDSLSLPAVPIHTVESLEERVTALEADVGTRTQILENLGRLDKRLTVLVAAIPPRKERS